MMSGTKCVYRMSVVALIVALTGCGQASAPQTASEPAKNAVASASGSSKAEGHVSHDHSGWWCGEHGVPEDECGRCNAKLAAQFQKKGDWCKEHDRPDSQCFICHPEKEAQYAAKYEAKFGEKPPKPEAN